MKRTIAILGVTLLVIVGLSQTASGQVVTNALTRRALQAVAWTFTAVQTFTGGAILSGNVIALQEETALVYVNHPATINKAIGFNRLVPEVIEVRSGCQSYDFTLNSSDTFAGGTELLAYVGQTYMLYDGAPPVLRDVDGTGEVHARFWNRGAMPCTFELVITGEGF